MKIKEKMMEQNKTTKLIIITLTLSLVCSVIINILLARKVEHFRYIEKALRAEGELQAGEIVPPLQVKQLNGNSIAFPYGNNELPLILYVIAPGCTWCEKNQPNAEVIAKELFKKYRFVALSLDSKGLKEYVQSHQIPFDVYEDLPQEISSKYKFGGTPQTIVISSEGKVLQNWRGAYTGDLKAQVEKFFSISLPGIDANK